MSTFRAVLVVSVGVALGLAADWACVLYPRSRDEKNRHEEEPMATLFVTIEPVDVTIGRVSDPAARSWKFGVYVGPQSFPKRARYGANYGSRDAAVEHARTVADELAGAGHAVHRSF